MKYNILDMNYLHSDSEFQKCNNVNKIKNTTILS